MATRKSGDGAPQAPESKVEQRPGSYAQISGSRRKRKGKKQRSSRPSSAPVDARPESGETSEEGQQSTLDASAVDKASVPVDDLRAGRGAAPSNRSPRRALGPLGMTEQGGAPAGARPEPSEPKTKAPSQPRVKVVEINPAELVAATPDVDSTPPVRSSAPPPSDAVRTESSAPVQSDAGRLRGSAPPASGNAARASDSGASEGLLGAPRDDSSPLAGSDPTVAEGEVMAPTLKEGSEPPSSARADDRTKSGGASTSSESASNGRASIPAPTWGADELALGELDHGELADELGRPSLSSVFDARPSLRPSPAPAPEKSSPAFVLVVSLLCAIIATAGVVALREALDDAPAPRAPRTATSAPAADTAPAALREAEGAASPLLAPIADPSPEPGVASARANVDASVVQPVRRVVRVARAPVANTVSPAQPAAREPSAPADALPENPYNEP